jgi:hypothetical protein
MQTCDPVPVLLDGGDVSAAQEVDFHLRRAAQDMFLT